MRILVTGGAGMIGSVLNQKLLDWNDGTGKVVTKLTVVDNLYRKSNTNALLSMDERFEFIRADVAEHGELMSSLYREHDVILPLASLTGMGICDRFPGTAWATNYAAIADMVLDVRMLNKKIVVPVSISGYGKCEPGEFLAETAELHPLSVYGQSKIKAETAAIAEGYISLRLSTCFGPAPCMRLDLLVNNFTWDAYSRRNIVLFEKTSRRCYLHTWDAADAFIFALENYDKMTGEAYNVGLADGNLTKEELAKTIAKYTECHIIEAEFAKDKDARDYFISVDKITKLGFKPQYSIDDGIQQLLRFYSGITVDAANVFADNWVI